MSIDPRLEELQNKLSPDGRELVAFVLKLERKYMFQSLTLELEREIADYIVARLKKVLPDQESGQPR